MRKKKIHFPLLIIFALFLNPIVIGGLETVCYLLIYGIPLGYIFINFGYIKKYFRSMPLKIAIPLFWIFIALALSFIVPVLHGTYDYTYANVILAIFRKIIVLAFLFLATTKKHGREVIIEQFMLYYLVATILYVLSTILFAFVPSLRTMWQGFLHLSNTTLNLLQSYGYTNRFGWAGFAGFRNAIDCTVSVVFVVYLYASNKSRIRLKTPQFVILMLLCFLGNMFYGRSGVIASALCLATGLVLYKKINFKVVFGILIVGLLGALAINFFRQRVPAINEWYVWISTPFYNLITTGSFNNYSANRLLNEMIFMPEGYTLLFGDGRYVDLVTGSYYMSTDSGFMRQILFWGVGITGVMYAVWLYSLLIMKRDVPIKIMLLIMCILFEIKGEVYYEMMPLFLIINLIDLENKKYFSVSGVKKSSVVKGN